MADYRIRILKAAAQDLERLDKPAGRRIVQRINWPVQTWMRFPLRH